MLNKIRKIISKLTRKHLLVIKVENVNAPPVIIYKGKKIQTVSEVDFSWDSDKGSLDWGHDFLVKHLVKDEDKLPAIERIGFTSPSREQF
ncbi:hypothetical protein HMPREF3124_08315 [Staphylococcus sp. HMSC12H08]|uniref:hypothetical protein n=1 Tax=Staphylococcus sp. HMSC12H08 TaxID=1581092 RepID=UPI0008A3B688|nr:hypothetical protein [Staphylococcus sp. HMSC12H08]OFV05144.1 hypothetical protein HMPREF3124_08315 [Staphylococcus sp. HMSC12H08]